MNSAVLVFLMIFTVSGNMEDLVKRVEKLEEAVENLEESMVTDYGLVRRCRLQTIENGKSVCRFKGMYIQT